MCQPLVCLQTIVAPNMSSACCGANQTLETNPEMCTCDRGHVLCFVVERCSVPANKPAAKPPTAPQKS